MRNTGIDPMRGRPTPGLASTEEKIQRRKLDSLKRGIHRIKDEEGLPYRVHLVGIGGAGTAIVARTLAQLTADVLDEEGARVSALAIDIGDADGLKAVAEQADRIKSPHAHIEVLRLGRPDEEELHRSLDRYPDFLRLEYPLYEGGLYEPWLNGSTPMSALGKHLPRAVAKAVYGKAYYDDERPADAAIRRFADSVAATPGESLVCICFGLGGGVGGGIAVDLARHISNVRFGRRVLVTGIGIAPCDGDPDSHRTEQLYPMLNELDCMSDEAKNKGVVMACGDLYKNPFTAGFLLVPQQHAWAASGDLESVHDRIDGEVASLITSRKGANLWEVLRLLNWVAAPSTQHSAARTPYGSHWIHMFGFADAANGNMAIDSALPERLGLSPTYRPEFVEARIGSATDCNGAKVGEKLNAVFGPVIEPVIAEGGLSGSVQFILPQISKTDLTLFADARNAYDAQTYQQKVLHHSWLLERGVVLCEPSSMLEGMAGASLSGQSGWVAVPYASLRGEHVCERNAAVAASS